MAYDESAFDPQEATNNSSLEVGTTTVQVSGRRSTFALRRKEFVYTNNSPADADIVWISLDNNQPAQVGKGIKLLKNASIAASEDSGYRPFQGLVTAVCETANGVIAIFER